MKKRFIFIFCTLAMQLYSPLFNKQINSENFILILLTWKSVHFVCYEYSLKLRLKMKFDFIYDADAIWVDVIVIYYCPSVIFL